MHVALIDSDRMVIQLVQQYLSDAGHSFAEVEPNLEAIKTGGFDLIIMDFNQKSKTDPRLYDSIRSFVSLQSIPCLLVSGQLTMNDLQIGKKDKLTSFLIKPFTKSVFEDAMQRCIRQSVVRNCQNFELNFEEIAEVPEETAAKWRRDLDEIVVFQQGLKTQLQLNASDIFEIKHKELKSKGDVSASDLKALRKSIIDMILLKSIVIVDKDQSHRLVLQDYARQQSIMQVDAFEDGQDAWKHLQENSCDLIVMDWTLEAPGGLCLYNRLRSKHSTAMTPIIILIKASDLPAVETLIEEDLHIVTLEKPLQPKKIKVLTEQLMTRSLSAHKLTKAFDRALEKICSISLLKDLVKDLGERLPGMKLYLVDTVHRLLDKGRYEDAERLARLLVEKPDLAVAASTVLAKIYHLSQRPHAAIDLLRYICALAPHRLDHLLLAAEAEITVLHIAKANRYLDRAELIDRDDKKISALRHISEKFEEHANLLSKSPLKNLVSSLNTVGVTLAQSGKTDDAIRYYESALMIDSDRIDQARLHFNLGLSYERAHAFEKALDEYKIAEDLAGTELPKAKNSIERLQAQLKKSGS